MVKRRVPACIRLHRFGFRIFTVSGFGFRVSGSPLEWPSRGGGHPRPRRRPKWYLKGEFFIDNLMVRIHINIVMIWWTDLASWELFEVPLLDSLISTFLVRYLPFNTPGNGPNGTYPCLPEILIPEPSTLNPKPCTLNPAPSTRNHELSTLDPAP